MNRNSHPTPRSLTPIYYLLAIISVWVVVQILFAIPHSIVNDWVGWRQADTQTIARNFLQPGSSIFYPQINWGRGGPGYVECEFQLYTYLIAQVMRITGESVWPGQIISLSSILLTSIIIFFLLRHHFKDETTAIVGAIVFLTSNGAVHLSTAVMPDSLCILFYSLGLLFFLEYLSNQKIKFLLLFTLFSTLAALIKPLALNLGIIQFCILFFGYRQFLKKPSIWISWSIIVLITASQLAFSYNLFLKYGNTFGVLGGESKFPTLHGLTVWIHYPKLLYMTVAWGLGILGALACVYLLVQRKFTFFEWALTIGNAAAILIPMRYTVNRGFAPHYYIFTALLGAWLSAYAFNVLMIKSKNRFFQKNWIFIISCSISIIYLSHLYLRMHPGHYHYNTNITQLGHKLAEIAEPNSLAIVRSIANKRERSTWGDGINNYEDPRIFYIANIKGWPLPADAKGYKLIEQYMHLGADYFVETYKRENDPELYDWLGKHSQILFEGDIGIIYKLDSK